MPGAFAIMPHRLIPQFCDAVLYLVEGLRFVGGLVAQAVPAPGPGTANALNGGTIAAIVVAAITAATPLVLRGVDLVRCKEAIRQYRHYARNLENRVNLKDGEIRMLRAELIRAGRKHDFDLPPWFFDHPQPDPNPDPNAPPGPILPPVVTPDPHDPERETPRR
jgi:hypothetical protein